jgi:hypothetical protein
MRRTVFLISLVFVLATALVVTASAFGANVPGHNLPTKRLEAAYKIALQERRFNPDGCYPAPPKLARAIREETKRRVGVSPNPSRLRNLNQVYVIRRGTKCGQLRMALRAAGGTYVLDSRQGTIRILGRKGASTPGLARPLSDLVLATKTTRVTKADSTTRLQTICPGGRFPVGGGMVTDPPTSADGEGIYPHSYERLGAQRGWHISVVFFDPSRESTTPRDVAVQVLCARGVIPATPTPHDTVYVRPGQTKTVTARCPRGQFLVSGGFQRTDFRSDGGDYVTESRAIGTKVWTVTGHAFGTGSGELTAIAYCARMKRPLLQEVTSSPVPIGASTSARTTTAACPGGTRLVAGGFSTGGSINALFDEGTINRDNTFTASTYGFFGPATGLTAYGYCWPARG